VNAPRRPEKQALVTERFHDQPNEQEMTNASISGDDSPHHGKRHAICSDWS
jgi:hypothetical protein